MQYHLATRFGTRLRGLLGTNRDDISDTVLIIAPCSSIHTFGMRYSIDVAFSDRSGAVLKIEREVPPGRILRCKHAYFVYERASAADKPWFTCGTRLPLCLHTRKR